MGTYGAQFCIRCEQLLKWNKKHCDTQTITHCGPNSPHKLRSLTNNLTDDLHSWLFPALTTQTSAAAVGRVNESIPTERLCYISTMKLLSNSHMTRSAGSHAAASCSKHVWFSKLLSCWSEHVRRGLFSAVCHMCRGGTCEENMPTGSSCKMWERLNQTSRPKEPERLFPEEQQKVEAEATCSYTAAVNHHQFLFPSFIGIQTELVWRSVAWGGLTLRATVGRIPLAPFPPRFMERSEVRQLPNSHLERRGPRWSAAGKGWTRPVPVLRTGFVITAAHEGAQTLLSLFKDCFINLLKSVFHRIWRWTCLGKMFSKSSCKWERRTGLVCVQLRVLKQVSSH